MSDMLPVLYLCDPKLNKPCSKTHCHSNMGGIEDWCTTTSNPEYARKGTRGFIRRWNEVNKKYDIIYVGEEI